MGGKCGQFCRLSCWIFLLGVSSLLLSGAGAHLFFHGKGYGGLETPPAAADCFLDGAVYPPRQILAAASVLRLHHSNSELPRKAISRLRTMAAEIKVLRVVQAVGPTALCLLRNLRMGIVCGAFVHAGEQEPTVAIVLGLGFPAGGSRHHRAPVQIRQEPGPRARAKTKLSHQVVERASRMARLQGQT